MRKFTMTLGAATLLAASAWPAQAAPPPPDTRTAATCTWEATLHQSYGLTLTPSSSTFEAKDGVITCDGEFEGRTISADPGTISFVGGTTDTWCAHGTGWVDVSIELRSTDGRKVRAKASGTWQRYGLAGTFAGDVDGTPAAGPIVAEPLNGNCDLDNPLTPEDEGEPVRDVTLRSVLRVG